MWQELDKQLESLNITDISGCEYEYIKSLDEALFPHVACGNERPCLEDDFCQFKLTIDEKLSKIRALVEQATYNKTQYFSPIFRKLRAAIVTVCGEQHEFRIWNTQTSVAIVNEICNLVCNLYNYSSISRVLSDHEELLTDVLSLLQQKLQKETWKTYPTAVTCYKWVLNQVEEPILYNHIHMVLPATLIIIDDFDDENVYIGLDFLSLILRHCSGEKSFSERGYDALIYDVLMKLIIKEHKTNLKALLSNMATVLNIMDQTVGNKFEWNKRDTVLQNVLSSMEFESNCEVRLQYMSSLPKLINNYGCATWFSKLTHILSEYCENHTDVKTLKTTLETARFVLTHFRIRMVNHSEELYKTFLKLHLDLTETPVFDSEIIHNLECCICLLYNITPGIGKEIMRDTRVRSIIKTNLPLTCLGDVRYFD